MFASAKELDESGYYYENDEREEDSNLKDGCNINGNDNEGSMEFVPSESAMQARKVLKRRCWRDGKARYAIKQLRPELLEAKATST